MSELAPEDGPDPRLVTTPDNPGLYVYAPVPFDLDDEFDRYRGHFGPLIADPRISYACRCGFVRRGVGDQAVRELLANYPQHATACPLAPRLLVPAPAAADQVVPGGVPCPSRSGGVAGLAPGSVIFDPDQEDGA